MPLYEFECPLCHEEQEHLMSLNAAMPTLECKYCDFKGEMKRLISRPAPHQLVGAPQLRKDHANLRKRNAEYNSSKKGIERRIEHIANARRRGLPA